MRSNLLLVHFKYTTLLYWIFMHLSVPTCITHQRTSTWDKMPWVDNLTAPEPQAAPLPFPDWDVPVIGSRAVLAQGCPVIQIPCYEKAEANLSSWGQICHVALDSSCRLSSAQSYNAKWDTQGTPCCCKSQCVPVLHRSLGSQLHTDLRMQLAGLRLHHTPCITQHCYPFKSIHVLKNLEKPCCLILSKVPGIHFHFHLWTFYSAPNIETYSTKSTHSSLLRCLCSRPNDRDSSAVTGCRTRHLWKSHFGNRKYSL